jgi:hypothetical protein
MGENAEEYGYHIAFIILTIIFIYLQMELCTVRNESQVGGLSEKMEADPEEIKSIAEHMEVPKKEAAVKPVRALKKRHGGQNLAVRCCQKPKKRTQGNVGSYKTLAAACRGMTCRAIPVQNKGHCCQGQGKNI